MSFKDRAVIASLKVLPQKTMSHVAGVLFGLELPKPLAKLSVSTFAKMAGVNLDEAKEPVESFPSIQKFFVRELKEGARTVDADEDALVSPCDGAWGACGPVEGGTVFQVKGRPYSVATLLDDEALAARFEGGTFATLYLSPKDYHRFHAPCAGDVKEAWHIPGALWPVNNAGIQFVDGLFARNERIVALLRPDHQPDGLLAMIAVGATMVGKVHVTFDDLTTNNGARETTRRAYEPPKRLEKGQEWGRFEFGSTVVLVATRGLFDLAIAPAGTPLRLGARIGTLG